MEKHEKEIREKSGYLFKLSATVFVLCGVNIILIQKYDGMYSYLAIISMLEVAAYIFGTIYFENKIKQIPKLNCFLKSISAYSFGIFILHPPIIYFIQSGYFYKNNLMPQRFDLAHNSLNCFLLSTMMFLISFFGSMLIIFIVKKVLNKLGIKNTRPFIGA